MYHDTVIYTPIGKNLPSPTIQNFQSNLDNFSHWCLNNKLSIHENKTQIMLLGKFPKSNRQNKHDLTNLLHLNNVFLKPTTTYPQSLAEFH